MKLCVLGNSHVASLKSGWDLIKGEYQGHLITFFATRGLWLTGLKLDKQSLVPTTPSLARQIAYTSGGVEFVSLKEYDIFLIYGLGLRIPRLDTRYSADAIQQTFVDIVVQSLSFELAKLIRSASSAPIYIGHDPQTARKVDTKSRIKEYNYNEAFCFMRKAFCVSDCLLIDQPIVTLANGWNTNEEYSVGSTRLDIGDEISGELHPDRDMGHMNGLYGKVWLRSFFDRLT